MHWRVHSSILGLYPLDASSTYPFQLWQPKISPDTDKHPLRAKSTLDQLRTTDLDGGVFWSWAYEYESTPHQGKPDKAVKCILTQWVKEYLHSAEASLHRLLVTTTEKMIERTGNHHLNQVTKCRITNNGTSGHYIFNLNLIKPLDLHQVYRKEKR